VPVTWSISHEERLVLLTLEGEVQAKDIQQFISTMVAEGLEAYRKLFDARYMTPGGLRLSDLKAFSTMIVARAKEKPMGPVAFVVGSDLEREMAEVYGKADTRRPLAIFSDLAEAQRWLDRPADGAAVS
jgi:hypothetical protein